MLKEMAYDDFKLLGRKRPDNPDRKFAERAVWEFTHSDAEVCEVTGWPSGDPSTYKEASRKAALLRHECKRTDAVARQRKNRIFLVKRGVANG